MLLYYCFALAYSANFLYEMGWISFFLLSIFLFFFLKNIILPIFDIEISTCLDALFSLESPNNVVHIVSCCTFEEKVDIEAIKSKIKQNLFKYHQFRKMRKYFKMSLGLCYWKTDPNFKLDDHIEVIEEIPDLEQLHAFMADHVNEIRFPKETTPWRLFIIKNLAKNRSGLVLKLSHGLADGMSLMNVLLIVGESKPYELIHLPKINNWGWIMIYLFGFFQMVKVIKGILAKKQDDNCFRKITISKKKNGSCSQQIDLKIIKEYAKSIGVGINDVVMALLSQALRNYHLKKFNKDLTDFSISLAASVVPPPKPSEAIPMHNHITALSEKLYFEQENESFSDYTKRYHLMFKHLKTSYVIYLQKLCAELNYIFFPIDASVKILDSFTLNHSATYTSVPGPITTVSMFGYDVKELFFFVNGFGHIPMVYNIFTYNEKLVLAGIADENTGIKVKELIAEFVRLFEEKIVKRLE